MRTFLQYKPVMVKLRCPTCAAGRLGTKDDKMHHMCERGVNEGSARRRGLGSSLELFRLLVHAHGLTSQCEAIGRKQESGVSLSLQVPTEAILKKTWAQMLVCAKKLAAERYTDNDSDEDGPVRHHYFPMLQKWYLFAMPLVQIIQSEPEEVTEWAYSVL
ncbi:BQ5605_C005g03664 [Microbotryum silenes-dioicae]|uniref:BQ5605_C005g03664 protein n=1 Tax=Microbotryum silenes-dioicae TaxID=796604 RepID=A0A2X0MYE2_9BASI|nr:BQ5605_C005g03664 [Microbotryum silenes-dioicae]